MIIVNQDREMIVNFSNIEYIWISKLDENDDDTFKIVAQAVSGNMIIGRYKTEERAKEVLKEIMKKYKDCNWSGSSIVANEVFYMPQK